MIFAEWVAKATHFLAFPSGRLSHKMGEMSAKQTERDGPCKGKVALRSNDG